MEKNPCFGKHNRFQLTFAPVCFVIEPVHFMGDIRLVWAASTKFVILNVNEITQHQLSKSKTVAAKLRG